MITILNKTRIVRIVSFQTSLRRSLDPRHYTSRSSFQMSDVESRMSVVGCRMSNLGCRMSDLGCRLSDVKSRMSDVGCQIWDVGCRMSDVELISDVRCQMAPISFRRFLPQSELSNFRNIQLRFLAQKSELSMFQIDNSYFCVINPSCVFWRLTTR